MSSLPIDSASELATCVISSDSTGQNHTSTSSESAGPTTTSTASMTMLATLDVRDQGLEWRLSLSDPQTPSGNLDVLHEFIESWDDDMLRSGCEHPADAGVVPMMALLAASSSPPLHARQVHVQSPMVSVSKLRVVARNASPTNSSSDSDKGVTGLLFDDNDDEDDMEPVAIAKATTAARAPARKRIRRKVEIAQLRDEGAFLEKQLYELREFWKNAPKMLEQRASNSTSSLAMVCAEPMWKQIAHHQKALLAEAERKNLLLRTEYTLQRKIARGMRKVLKKRATSPTVSSSLWSCIDLFPFADPIVWVHVNRTLTVRCTCCGPRTRCSCLTRTTNLSRRCCATLI